MTIWRTGRFRGANVRLDATLEDLKELATWGGNLIRVELAETVVESDPPYRLKEAGLAQVDRLLEAAQVAGLPVVVAFRLAPGRSEVSDRRIWEQPETHLAFAKMWKAFAERYRRAAGIVGYDLLSEPNPESLFNGDHPADQITGTTADWNILARRLTMAIREVDTQRPLLVEASAWAYARGFEWLKPTGDDRTIYSFHMYSPHKYTHQENDQKLIYPGVIPGHVEPTGEWDRIKLAANLRPAMEFQKKTRAPLFVGEFGVRRSAPAGDRYVRDLLVQFEEYGWHWAFWSFRTSAIWNPELARKPTAAAR